MAPESIAPLSGQGRVRLYGVTPEGPRALFVPPPGPGSPGAERARSAHELFDALPLGVYSALRTFQHDRFLCLEQHLERTDRSLALLGWPERLERAPLCRALDAVVRAFPEPEAFVRFDLLAEPASSLGFEGRTLLALSPLVAVPPEFLRLGVGVGLSPLRRARPLIKTASFVVERRPYPLGERGAYEHLILDAERRILEGTSSNFAVVLREELRLAGDEALQGVTQRIVAQLAAEHGLAVRREPVRLEELSEASEAFLTGSTRGVVPVVQVAEQTLGAGTPGPWTQRLTQAYLEFARREAHPAFPLGG